MTESGFDERPDSAVPAPPGGSVRVELCSLVNVKADLWKRTRVTPARAPAQEVWSAFTCTLGLDVTWIQT